MCPNLQFPANLVTFSEKILNGKLNFLCSEYTLKIMKTLKGYLSYKTIFCNKVALDVKLMTFFIWRKSNVSFSRYLHFCVFVKSTDFKICDVIVGIAKLWKLHLYLFLLNSTYFQNDIWLKTSVLYEKHFWYVFGLMLETAN